ncbi:hypothetical protein [Novosphingobium terrae]|uniref:hypothetical protein n=1 Tax=Novosphingobium terrae TaxID=2726189 RepID=UPI001981CBE5|nr:hypothetical protein [Novosphingobium terrae]
MKFGLIVAASLMTMSPAAQAQDAKPAASEAAATPAPVKEKRTCRLDDDTSSIVPKRICHTKAEWAAIEAEQNRSLNFQGLQNTGRR